MLRCNPTGTAAQPNSTTPIIEVTSSDQVVYPYGSCMLKLNRDGTPDASFGTGGLWQLDNDGLALTRVLLRKDGNFGVAGIVAKMSLSFAPIRRYQFDSPQPYPTSVANSRGLPALDASDRVLIAGFVADSGLNKQTNYIARFEAQMRLDTSFGSLGNGLAPVGNADLGLFVPLSLAVDSSNRMVFAGYLQVQNPKIPQYFAHSDALIRMQTDAPASAAGAGSGGCGTGGNARFEPPFGSWLRWQ